MKKAHLPENSGALIWPMVCALVVMLGVISCALVRWYNLERGLVAPPGEEETQGGNVP